MSKKTVEQYLNNIIYTVDPTYSPTEFALEFITFIKLVNGNEGEEHKSPVIHYKMLDKVEGKEQNIINMCSRGLAKTTLLGEYLILYLAVYGSIPNFGKIPLGLYVSDSIENGVKNMRKNLEYRWENSSFLQLYIPKTRFTDVRWEFTNKDGEVTLFKGYSAKALSLNTRLYKEDSYTTIGECSVGDKVFGPDGKLHSITAKSEVFNKPMYEIVLIDGRKIQVSEDHINNIVLNTNPNNTVRMVEKNLTTLELLKEPLLHVKKTKDKKSTKHLVWVKNTEPMQYPEKPFTIEPYTLGLMLGDGSIKADGSCVLHGEVDDIDFYKTYINEEFGSSYLDKRNNTAVSLTFKAMSARFNELGLKGIKMSDKFIPKKYLFGSIKQRLNLLKGLLDTDGTISKTSRISFSSASKQLIEDVAALVRSLGGTAYSPQIREATGKWATAYKIEILMPVNPFKLPRKALRWFYRKGQKQLVAVDQINKITQEPSQCIAIDSADHLYLAGEYITTHNTEVRGTKEMGQRPYLAILDDLISDEDARSATVIASIEDTVYKAIDYALHPTRRKIIWSGTPFNSRDPLYKAVESGAWAVSVFPVCEQFPCSKEEFKGAWEDRFSYEYVHTQYTKALKVGKIDTFNQELMLRIMSEEDRLIADSDISWYKRESVIANKGLFNFYITTDFATSEKTSADFSVISVWALNSHGDWFWVDGICKKQLMDKNINDLFRLAQKYSPQSVGIEVSGQQSGFIPWIQKEMLDRNIYFSLASEGNKGNLGIRPSTNKMVRFNVMVPMFKANKIFFPKSMEHSVEIIEAMDEIRLASPGGFKSKHDDFIDTISMLGMMDTWKPSEYSKFIKNDNNIWEDEEEESNSNLSSYIV